MSEFKPSLPVDLSSMDPMSLLRLPYLAIAEARRRGLVRTRDLPTGGYAEHLAGLVYGATPLGAIGVGHDVIAPDGRKIEVKAIASGSNTSPAYPDLCDAVVVVRFDPETLGVLWAFELPSEDVELSSRPHKNGGRTLPGPRNRPNWAGAVDRTNDFLEAERQPWPEAGNEGFQDRL